MQVCCGQQAVPFHSLLCPALFLPAYHALSWLFVWQVVCMVGGGSEHRGTAWQEVDLLQHNPLRCSNQKLHAAISGLHA